MAFTLPCRALHCALNAVFSTPPGLTSTPHAACAPQEGAGERFVVSMTPLDRSKEPPVLHADCVHSFAISFVHISFHHPNDTSRGPSSPRSWHTRWNPCRPNTIKSRPTRIPLRHPVIMTLRLDTPHPSLIRTFNRCLPIPLQPLSQ